MFCANLDGDADENQLQLMSESKGLIVSGSCIDTLT
jgi:hypothetical protein